MKLIALTFLISFQLLIAQNVDSLFNEALTVINRAKETPQKCGFELASEIRLNYDKFSEAQKKQLRNFLSRPSNQTSIKNTRGWAKIHYDTTGANVPTYSVYDLLAALDTVYQKEIEEMGFPLPPTDGNFGGDSAYDIYIQNLGNAYYGYTMPENLVAGEDSAFTSFIVINSSFQGFYTEGINAARVTVAHEFHHAIQMGNYILRTTDTYFYELTSVSMEEFVFPYVNDYIAYLPEYFNNPAKAFPDYTGYNLGVWNLFLRKELGFSIFLSQWEKMKRMRAALAIEFSLEENNLNFTNALAEFGKWNFFTDYRAKGGKYYADARKFPLIRPTVEISTPPAYSRDARVKPVSSNYIQCAVSSSARPDTITMLVVNGDVNSLFAVPYSGIDYSYAIYDNSSGGETPIAKKYSYDFQASDENYLNVVLFVNDELAEDLNHSAVVDVYPQPFIPQKHNSLSIKLTEPTWSAQLAIYRPDMSLVLNKELFVGGLGKTLTVEKNLLQLPSGIYIFILHYNDKTQKGKFAVINER